jgi:hypothetical protein
VRRLITVLVVAIATCAAALWWLHDGDLREAMEPVLVDWDATTLARDAGVPEEPVLARDVGVAGEPVLARDAGGPEDRASGQPTTAEEGAAP